MNPLLKSLGSSVAEFLNKRTGLFGLGPTNGEIIISHLIAWGSLKYGERSVVHEAEQILQEIDERNRSF
jgi:fucose permease